MEQLRASSGFEPVNIKFDSSGKVETMTSDYTQQPSHRNTVQRITVNMPLSMQSTSELHQQHRHQRQQFEQFDRLRECFSKQSVLQNYANFKRSAPPARLMYRKDGSWTDFSGEVVKRTKFAFLEHNAMMETEVDGNDYLFDFYRMFQIDIANGFQRSIAWVDVNGICYFPKFFVDDDGFENSCAEVPMIEIQVKLLENNVGSGKTKREDALVCEEEGDTASSSSKTDSDKLKRRRIDGVNLGSPRWPNARLIGEGDEAFSAIRNLFMAGMKTIDPGVKITSINRCMRTGPMEKGRWEVFDKQMEIMKASRGMSNAVFAWHGTSKKDVLNILAHGFGLPSKVSGSQAHGIGVYLSPARLPHISHMLSEVDENGERHVVLCRAILGNVEKVEAGSRQSHPSSLKFDSGVDDIGNPKWYVIWSMNMNTHILPECVVSYKCSDRLLQDSMKWIPNSSSSVVVKLFSKLGSVLPYSKVEELKSLCRSYKAGKMPKHSFIKQLRLVAGDETLLSAICALQGSK
ncbi:hypothetical protein Ancab_028783 [Ancistrocladus abbreviatus]